MHIHSIRRGFSRKFRNWRAKMHTSECCRIPTNLVPSIQPRSDLRVSECQICKRRHFDVALIAAKLTASG